jgi:hypothetical protein
MSNQRKSYRCVLVIDVEAKNKAKAAERFLNEVEQGWVLPDDVVVRSS